jgi:hypothetical protein
MLCILLMFGFVFCTSEEKLLVETCTKNMSMNSEMNNSAGNNCFKANQAFNVYE